MMFAKRLEKSGPKNILVISMTNIGDVVLSCPVIDILCRDFPDAKMDVVIGPKAVSLFAGNPNFGVKVFDKQSSLRQKAAWFSDLYRSHYDCVVDLRHTMLPVLLRPKYTTPSLLRKILDGHKKDIHLGRLGQVHDFGAPAPRQYAIVTTPEDEQFFEDTVVPFLHGQQFMVIAPGAADSAKRWLMQGFAEVAEHLAAKIKVILVGDDQDSKIIDQIQGRMKLPSMSLAGKINLRQLAYVLKRCSWAMTHDSGVMHLASYLNVPLVVLWGPTDIHKYGPWSSKTMVVRRNEQCLRCMDPKNKVAHQCMSFIQVEDVLEATINF